MAMSLFLICLLCLLLQLDSVQWVELCFASFQLILLTDNMSISLLLRDKVTRVILSYNSKREVLIKSDADLSWKKVNEFHVVT